MGRGVMTYSVTYLAGLLAGYFFSLPFAFTATALAILLFSCILLKKRAFSFFIISHLALFTAGAGAISLAESGKNVPPYKILSNISLRAATIQSETAAYFKKFCSSERNHSTLCALTIGIKDEMGTNLKRSYSKAGAMHILALSGLHIGIIYLIVGSFLSPLMLLPKGRIFKDTTALVFISLYSILCGCTPSVVRASTMILIYGIGKNCFRNVSKWDSLAISALAIGVFAPLQTGSIGFQLSYAAVIGISLFYPVFKVALSQSGLSLQALHPALKWCIMRFWDNISISVACQITTLPILLFYFGETATYFLITNLVAIPMATAILYTFATLLALQWIPFANTALSLILNFLIELLNNSVIFISN